MKTPAGQDANATRVQPAEAGGGDPFGLAPWLKEMPDVPLHPLMAHPVAAIAATTAIGFGIAGQMAGAMLGLMQSAAERTKAVLDEAAAQQEAGLQPVGRVKAKPVLAVVPKPPVAKAGRPAKTEAVAREKRAMPRTTQARTVRNAPAAKTMTADDLKAISGIGPKLEQVLNGMGVRRYADLAGLKPADVERIEAELGFVGRIARDGWVEQARALAKGRG